MPAWPAVYNVQSFTKGGPGFDEAWSFYPRAIELRLRRVISPWREVRQALRIPIHKRFMIGPCLVCANLSCVSADHESFAIAAGDCLWSLRNRQSPAVRGVGHFAMASKLHLSPPCGRASGEAARVHAHCAGGEAAVRRALASSRHAMTAACVPPVCVVPTSLCGQVPAITPLLCGHIRQLCRQCNAFVALRYVCVRACVRVHFFA